MFSFLTEYWERNGRPDEVGNLLGSFNLELGRDGEPADTAMWSDWLQPCARFRNQFLSDERRTALLPLACRERRCRAAP